MIATAERRPDDGQRRLGLLADQVHGHLPRIDDVLVAPLALHLVDGDGVVVGHGLLNRLDAHGGDVLHGDDVAQDLLGCVECHRLPVDGSVREHPDERTLQLADVLLDAVGDERAHVVGDQTAVRTELRVENRQASLKVRWLDVRHETTLEAAAQAVFQRRDVLWRAVAAHHDLLLDLVQCVERMEKLFLRPVLAGEELNVVDEQDVDGPVPDKEVGRSDLLNRRDHLLHELL